MGSKSFIQSTKNILPIDADDFDLDLIALVQYIPHILNQIPWNFRDMYKSRKMIQTCIANSSMNDRVT